MRRNLLCSQIETERASETGRSTETRKEAVECAFFRDAQQNLNLLQRNRKRVRKPNREACAVKTRVAEQDAQQLD